METFREVSSTPLAQEEDGDTVQLEESGQWYNCTHKNESYCQYTFLYREGAGDQGGVQVVMDPDSVRCPPPYNPDYLGWIMGKWDLNKQ